MHAPISSLFSSPAGLIECPTSTGSVPKDNGNQIQCIISRWNCPWRIALSNIQISIFYEIITEPWCSNDIGPCDSSALSAALLLCHGVSTQSCTHVWQPWARCQSMYIQTTFYLLCLWMARRRLYVVVKNQTCRSQDHFIAQFLLIPVVVLY
jgi:hypothetical protein